jgi:hypothetical protein
MESLEDRRLLSGSTVAGASSAINPGGPIILPSPGTGVTVHGEATDQFTAKLANLSSTISGPLATLSASVNWGDGTSSSRATLKKSSDGQISIYGTHKYAKTGTYHIDITVLRGPIIDPPHPVPQFIIFLGNIKTTAKIKADDDGGVSLTETATQKFTAKVGSFDFSTLDIVLAGTTIDWGDGHTSAGTLGHTGTLLDGEYNVIGTHTYAKTGTYKVHVIVHTKLAGSSKITGTAADFFSTIKVMGAA